MPRPLIDTTLPASLYADLQLDPTIQPTAPIADHWQRPESLFLTGATGFLGAYLVQELMARTQATIYYLSRQKTAQEANERLVQQLRSYQVWQEAYRPRLVPVLGDLAQPRLGLDERGFVDLAAKVQLIFHNGSWVNNLHDYAILERKWIGLVRCRAASRSSSWVPPTLVGFSLA